MGLAHPVSFRGSACWRCPAGAFANGGIAGIRPPAPKGHSTAATIAPRVAPSSHGHIPGYCDLGAWLHHVLRRDHLRPRIPDVAWRIAGGTGLVAGDACG